MKKQGLIVILVVIPLFLISFLHAQDSGNYSNQNIFLDMHWDEDTIRSNKEFKINLSAYDLEDSDYDVKIYIYNSNKKWPITNNIDGFDEVYSKDFLVDFFKGPGDKSKIISMRVRGESKGYFGTATIAFRIRENDSETFITEIERDIRILRPVEIDENANVSLDTKDIITVNQNPEDNPIKDNTPQEQIVTGEVIKITKEDTKITGNVVSSNSSGILVYFLYIFIGLFMLFLILLFLRFVRKKRQ